uniref:Uncharacterized protein n=2 Tax=Glossina morsitans morsitans TaxID=37546 RepID=A0A1B0G7F0_GLOMM
MAMLAQYVITTTTLGDVLTLSVLAERLVTMCMSTVYYNYDCKVILSFLSILPFVYSVIYLSMRLFFHSTLYIFTCSYLPAFVRLSVGVLSRLSSYP